jgi:hypothetical protein
VNSEVAIILIRLHHLLRHIAVSLIVMYLLLLLSNAITLALFPASHKRWAHAIRMWAVYRVEILIGLVATTATVVKVFKT